jgi:hypothetical protein
MRDVAGAHRVAVHGGVVESREIGPRGDGFRKDPPEGRLEAHGFGSEHADHVEQAPLCAGD